MTDSTVILRPVKANDELRHMTKYDLVAYGSSSERARRQAADELFRRTYDRAVRRGKLPGVPAETDRHPAPRGTIRLVDDSETA
jgi:hypothetical protein